MGERQWEFESDRQNSGIFYNKGYGEYFFSDTPISSDDNIPSLAKGEMAKKKIPKGSMSV